MTSSPAGTYIVITAYSITSAYPISGTCVTSSGRPISISTPFSLSKPSTTDSAQFQAAAESSFVRFLGFNGCIGAIQPSELVAIRNATQTNSDTAASLRNADSSSQLLTTTLSTNTIASPSSSSGPIHGMGQRNARIVVGVTIPIGSIAALVLGISLWRNYRKRRHIQPTNQIPQNQDSIAFLQQKAELEAQERRRCELHEEDIRHELEMNERRPELHGGRRWQELRSEEHSRELEAPDR